MSGLLDPFAEAVRRADRIVKRSLTQSRESLVRACGIDIGEHIASVLAEKAEFDMLRMKCRLEIGDVVIGFTDSSRVGSYEAFRNAVRLPRKRRRASSKHRIRYERWKVMQ